MKSSILIIDDELSACTLLSLALEDTYNAEYATDSAAAMSLLKARRFDVVLLDLMIGREDGLDVLKQIKAFDLHLPVVMITAFGSIRTSVNAMKNGAFTYLSKPLDLDELRVFIEQALSVRRLSDEIDYLSRELKERYQYHEMIGKSPSMQKVYSLIEKLNNVDSTVIVTGESGTGKELAARAIHYSGKRKNERFVIINCAAIPESLLEEELFGHKRGSFTDAMQDKKGKFEIADRGTVFLDEIGDMPFPLQSKILRVLQQKEFSPLGSNEVKHVDVRIIAATNQDIAAMVQEGRFREDLYYRLSVVTIHMPALRDRKEDIPLLCDHFIRRFNAEQNKSVQGLSEDAKKILMEYEYPGNVRQLANILEHAMILSSCEMIEAGDLPIDVCGRGRSPENSADESCLKQLLAGMPIRRLEHLAIEATLEKNGGRRDISARELGISIRGLQNKIAEYDVK